MQRAKKCLGIDLGSTSVKVAEVVAEKNGARVTRLLRSDLQLPPGPMDSDRVNALSAAVKELIKEHKITTKHAVFCLPGQSVFIRRIRVPRTTEERLKRIVAYEARQQIPFALDNSLMEYQVFDWGDSNEVEVLLVAIKKDIIGEFMKVVQGTGLTPILISVSTLALFNFHVFESTPFEELAGEAAGASAEPKEMDLDEELGVASAEGAKKKKFALPKLNFAFGKKKEPAGATAVAEPVAAQDEEYLSAGEFEDTYEEVRAYLNVGAQTFDLAIARLGRHKMLGFTRSVPWAGNELTRSLQEKLGLESLEKAEAVKRENAVVVIPGREEEANAPGVDPEASEFATSWADRLILDLRKSFDYYISQPDGMAVDSILMSGGQSEQRNLAAYIEDKLGIPVDVKQQAENPALAFADDVSPAQSSSYLVSLGLALTGVGYGPVTVDFLPPELKAIREFKKKNIEVFLLIGAIVGMLAVSTQIGSRRVREMQDWLNRNQIAINTATQTKASLQTARSAMEQVNQKYTALSEGINDRAFWLEFLGMIETAKPPEILITSISMKPDGTVEIFGEAEHVGPITKFVQNLQAQSDWIERVSLVNPRTSFSQFIGRQIQSFVMTLDVKWKETRLSRARGPWKAGTPTPQARQPAAPARGIPPGADPAMFGI